MNEMLLKVLNSEASRKLEQDVAAGIPAVVTGVAEGQGTFLACKLAETTGKRVLLLHGNDLKASKAADDAAQWLGQSAALLPGGEIDLTRGASSHESAWRRLETLCHVMQGETKLLCTSVEAALQRMGRGDIFKEKIITLKNGDIMDPAELMDKLVRMGYERVDLVEGKGQCAMRGSIFDCYPPASAEAYRIEFFGDEVDLIRTFDCISQRSRDNQKKVVITPASECVLEDDEMREGAERMREAVRHLNPKKEEETRLFDDLPELPDDPEDDVEYFNANISTKAYRRQLDAERRQVLERRISAMMEDADSLENGVPFRRIRAWLPVVARETATLLEWFRPEIIVVVEPDECRKRAGERMKGFAEDLENAMNRGEAVGEQARLMMDWQELTEGFGGSSLVAVAELLNSLGGLEVRDAIDLGCHGIPGYGGDIKALAADCRRLENAHMCVLLLSGSDARGKRLVGTLNELGVEAVFCNELHNQILGQVIVLPMTLGHGLLWEDAKTAIISDTEIWGSGYRKTKSRQKVGEKIDAFTDLKVGDYVVHEDHGVGIYQGTTRMQNNGTFRDYLLLEYAGNDKLYVPVEQLSRVQKYIGNTTIPPKINSIGGGEWQKAKSKAKASLKALAFDLVQLYAKRSRETGFAFLPDGPWQRDFEDRFPYELTPDQAQSVQEITADMESNRNMDRLLCGDVGYGKTEVALRAAFKAINSGKQVALLAPTTILAQQHYNTVLKRFDGFPINARVLSRFNTPKQTREILKKLEEGEIDLLVGTHRLLAKDVKFKQLGLLIVDEEQRFGVAHKEIIKNMKSQMDVLTLSATPIPRTLHMSMIGIRDMSVLETPPEERLPVQTHVVEYSDALIRDAILRELSRGGQVYFLYNRVRSIDEFAARLHKLVPEARIGVGHGKMDTRALEDVMMDFYGGSYDVLLCTTIIESGLDVPTANTLIVFDAERFGLGQLYQLRGRVGRSSRQAYAYFTVRSDRTLSETSQQRLQAIREFTEFGSGFRIAMRDLEIRGAGNVLGPEQHGFLPSIGYDMYCKLMEETLLEAKGEKPVGQPLETRIDLHVDAYLPAEYVSSEKLRMEIYKRIAGVATDAERDDIIEEMLDRFGDLPQPVENLLDIAQLRAQLNRLGVSNCTWRRGELIMRIDNRFAPDVSLLIPAMEKVDPRLSISAGTVNALVLKTGNLRERDIPKEGVGVVMALNAEMDRLKEEKAKQKK